ncbi:TPA: hypothetical protein ACX6O9_003891 [Photobacterium damselae]
MMKENIAINGITYQFETKNNKTELVYDVELTDSRNDDPINIVIPNVLVITRSSGEILFILECSNDEEFKILSASDLYDRKIQWFEPLADNYRKLLYVNSSEYTKSAYKVFSWDDIYIFSKKDRIPLAYASNNSGDWKIVKDGADGYLLSLIDGVPYWSDAVGQIPFAIDTYRMLKNPHNVVSVGRLFATGSLIDAVLGRADITNEWDNYFVLRGVIFAENKFKYRAAPYSSVSVEHITDYSPAHLSNPITLEEKQGYMK